jgi:hypothetical protein
MRFQPTPLRCASRRKVKREPLGGRRRHGLQPTTTTSVPEPKLATGSVKIRFDRNEFAGAFGDMGTDIPLLIGMTLAAGLDGTSVLVMFGAMQILTGLVYRLPMPVQPLKAMAAIVIAQQASPATLYGAGLAIGLVMLLLATTGLLDWLARVVPKCVVRGIQLGLGLQLASVALKFVGGRRAARVCACRRGLRDHGAVARQSAVSSRASGGGPRIGVCSYL